ncbi:3(2),5 -bisphosphate nucleotidase [Fulvivirga imtechensis AK7]|uniref:3(2),5-bisphosphate nucleotidase n=1 Tax=Fulvivirga imtechensis AK7 TaxID=1237149 RepID=L8JWB7_9BACT|nr:inositol monophosphatase family protein [Fulvivirga imtechensis]ELR71517.1 3(2),5 -bisphosphate nucleotidase [Fulvivirga imtechensis AK7]
MTLQEKDLRLLCRKATSAALAAGQYIQSRFAKYNTKTHKEGGNSLASRIVTDIDVRAQEIIFRSLHNTIQSYGLGLLAEEGADDQSRVEKSYFWCIDPMDGTLPFTEGRTGYAVSIALITNSGDPVIGVVYVPDLELCYTSIKGWGVWLNDEPFARANTIANDTIHVYMDRSFQSEDYFQIITNHLNEWATHLKARIHYHSGFGAVRNALGVMNSGAGCYFKFPKKLKGGGSIWDYAATRLFFEELGLHVSDSRGKRLHLNNPETTFMHDVGILYTTHGDLADCIITLGQKLEFRRCPDR